MACCSWVDRCEVPCRKEAVEVWHRRDDAPDAWALCAVVYRCQEHSVHTQSVEDQARHRVNFRIETLDLVS
jgi:hypothetical protein